MDCRVNVLLTLQGWAAIGLLALAAGCVSPLPPADAVSAWRVGPLLEGARTGAGDRLLAVRPLFSREETGDGFRGVTDILWPVGTFHHRGDRRSWRLIPAYGMGDDAPAADGAHRFRLLPIFFEGRTRAGEDYWGLFPLYGEIRDFLGMGDVQFRLFPLYATAQDRGTLTRTVLWPFYLTREGERIDQFRLWPFYGRRTVTGRQANTRSFILWPIWSQVRLENDAVRGEGFVLFPLYGQSRFERRKRGVETGWTVLPPFISSVKGDDGYRSLRAPWPFIRQLDDADRHERHWWPLYGTTRRGDRRDWYAVWPIIAGSAASRDQQLVRQFQVAPFYFQETRATQAASNGVPPRVTARFRRLWPLYSWQRNEQGARLRVPELSLFRMSEPIERNWAPLWSWFVRRERADGARITDLFWGLAAWGRDAEARRFAQLLWVFHFKASRPAADAGEDAP